VSVTLIIFLLCVLCFGQLVLPLLVRYQLGRDRLEVRVAGAVPIFRVPYNQIESIGRPDLSDFLLALRLPNRLLGPFVVIRRSSGTFRRVILSAADPDEFLRELGQRVLPRIVN
jgi:hypothetical protein